MRGAQNRHHGTAQLPVGAVPALPRRRILGLWLSRLHPRADILKGALLAAWILGDAHECAQLHNGSVPHAGYGGILRHQLFGKGCFGDVQMLMGQRLAHDGAGVHPANIGVDNGGASAEGEDRNRRRGVCPHAGKLKKFVIIRRNLAVMMLRNSDRRAVQSLGAARVAQTTPGAHRLRAVFGCEGCGRGPAAHPLFPNGKHAVHRGLLQHEFAHHNTPGRAVGAAPGQVAGMVLVPSIYAVV